MKLLFTLLITLCIIMLAQNNLRKHAIIWYCTAFLLSLGCLLLPSSTPPLLTSFATNIIGRGTLATALFILVMYARIFPVKSRLFRTFMSLRAPLAIMASFMILLHNGTYFIHYYTNITKKNVSMTPSECLAACCTILMLVLLIPLTITSFSIIRKKMKARTWKNVQRFSYLFYGLIYLHVVCLFSQQIRKGNRSYQLELAIYTMIFGIYLVCRVALYLKAKQKNKIANVFRTISLPIVLCLSFALIMIPFSHTTNTSQKIVVLADEAVASADTEALSSTEQTIFYKDGTWTGTALGYNDNITVSVTISGGKITEISVVEGYDDEPYYDWARDEIPQNIIETQTTNIDTVSGATFSSKGIIRAVEAALENALKQHNLRTYLYRY